MTAVVALVTLSLSGMAQAAGDDPDPGKELVINGDMQMVTRVKAPDNIPGLTNVYSGWLFHDPSTQAMEMDDFDNPGMTGAETGTENWSVADGSEGKSCASCHGDIEKMKGVRTHMPKVNKDGKLWSMEDYINNCRTTRMGAKAWSWNSADMQDMVAAISVQSRGMPMAVATDGAAAKFWKEGEKMYYTRTGMLELSCASCHEQNYGNHIRAEHLSQGQLNGFPTYRLKTAKLVSIHNRLKGCVRDTRAETYKEGTDALRILELYVASRSNGLSVEGVAVRP
ncbi:sulfur oxidation c-type cytochrome SoxA [Acidimangrovimonas pyrenivorans]|uniref:SoxAX cytochrome complex subunit A n=1 Tax=Acidimangrovimonas pyrenivorans TaxID=2030798 RepID=A0ABV7AHM6_9RHOB